MVSALSLTTQTWFQLIVNNRDGVVNDYMDMAHGVSVVVDYADTN